MLSGIKKFVGSHLPDSFKSVRISKVSKVTNSKHRSQMCADINEIAAQSSKFAHHIVPFSPSAAVRFKRENADDSTINSNELDVINSTVDNTRANMLALFKSDIENGAIRNDALVHAHSEYLIEVMQKQTGNCAEKALLAGMLIKATIEAGLKLRGYTDEEIESADIQLTIADNGKHGGDHTVCVLSYDIDGEHYLVVDPWINGATYTVQESAALYAAHLVNPDESVKFDRVHEDKTFVVNDNGCASAVLRWVVAQYDIDLYSPNPFKTPW